MGSCETPDLGRIKKVGLFLLDDCLRPIYGPGMGYIDDCPANFDTSDNIDDGDDFTRKCADGSIKRYIPGVKSLQSIEVNVDLHWLDPEWLAAAGGAQPVTHNGQVIGWSDCTRDRFNVAVVVWQEILGADACSTQADVVGCPNFVRIYPVKGARMTSEGSVGAEDSYMRLTGLTTDAHALGSGPVPLACNPTTGAAEWLSDCLASGCHRFQFTAGPSPDVCGIMDLTEPPTDCTQPATQPAAA